MRKFSLVALVAIFSLALTIGFGSNVQAQTASPTAGMMMTPGMMGSCPSFSATLDGAQEVPPVTTSATGSGSGSYDEATKTFTYNVTYSGITSTVLFAHVHLAPRGVAGPVLFPLITTTNGYAGSAVLTDAGQTALYSGNLYFNIHSQSFPGGEIRGQITCASTMMATPGMMMGSPTASMMTPGVMMTGTATMGGDMMMGTPTTAMMMTGTATMGGDMMMGTPTMMGGGDMMMATPTVMMGGDMGGNTGAPSLPNTGAADGFNLWLLFLAAFSVLAAGFGLRLAVKTTK